MIKIQKKADGFFDTFIGDVVVRSYADTHARGYLASINHTPADASWSDLLNLDIVLADRLNFFSNYEFKYHESGERLARRKWWGVGEFKHMHLMVNQQQIEQLQALLYKKIKLEGDEIALTRLGGGSFFLIDNRVPEWLGLPPSHELVAQTRAAAQLNQTLNRSACHSIKPHKIEAAGFFTF